MTAPNMIERLVKAARQKGGERLDLHGGKPALLVVNGALLQAGKAVVSREELEHWVEAIVGAERWVAFELGGEVVAPVELEGEAVTVRARRAAGEPQVVIELAPGAAPAAAPRPLAPVPAEPAQAAAPKKLERPLD